MIHVAILASAANIHTVRWVTALAERGCRISLMSQHPPAPELAEANVEVHILAHRGLLGYARNAAAVRSLFRATQADFLHVHYVGGYGLTALLSGVQPLMMSVWGADVYDVPARSPLHRLLIKTILQRATLISSTSEVMAQQTRSLGVSRPIEVVPFGVDTARFAPMTDRKDGVLTFGTVKTLHPKYGIDTLIEAFSALLSIRPELGLARARLKIVGGGDYGPEYKILAEALGITDLVDFPGPIPHGEVPATLREMDIFVAASRLDSESFGVAVIEASACGLPVIVSDAGGLPEVVLDGVTGLIVPRERPAVLAHAMARLADDSRLRMRMGEAGRRHVSRRYEWNVCVDAMLDCYRRMTSKR